MGNFSDKYYHESGHVIITRLFEESLTMEFVTVDEKTSNQYDQDSKGGVRASFAILLADRTVLDHDKAILSFFAGLCADLLVENSRNIQKEFYEHFFLCLFTITIIDLTIFSHYRDHYSIFRNKTRYPKFGWSGFGPHYENPKKLLDIPFQKGLLRIDKIDMDEYVQLFISETNFFLESNLNQIKTVDFFNSLLTDKDFQVSENENSTLTPLIINKLKENFGK